MNRGSLILNRDNEEAKEVSVMGRSQSKDMGKSATSRSVDLGATDSQHQRFASQITAKAADRVVTTHQSMPQQELNRSSEVQKNLSSILQPDGSRAQ